MRGFVPLTLAVLVAICGSTAAVNRCLDLNTGRCSTGSTSVNLDLCRIADDDVEAGDLKACFAQIGEGNIESLSMQLSYFTALPADIFDGFGALTTLDLNYGSLQMLPEGMFNSLGQLTYLDLGLNSLTTLPAGVFDSLEALTYLDLRGNGLGTLPEGIFDSLEGLTQLNLAYNSLTSLNPGVFDSLGALTTLNLYKTDLETLPEGIFGSLKLLTSLNLVLNDLKTLPAGTFDSTTLLTEMSLDYNNLETLPTGLFDTLTQLTYVGLSSNSLTELPAGLFDSQTLVTEMHLDFNDLKTLPGGLFDSLDALEILEVHHNELETLPEGLFDSLNVLTTLNLGGNDFKTLPTGLFDSTALLTSITLSDNALETVPAGLFDTLTQLKYVSLQANALTELPAGLFDSQTLLTDLHLGSNNLKTLPGGLFDFLEALETLSVYSNELEMLPAGIFDSLNVMTKLDLDSNYLTTLPAGVFDSLEALTQLYLRRNQLTTLPAGIFDALEVLKRLYLANNPDLKCLPTIPPSVTSIDINVFTISCDCDFGDLADPCDDQGLRCTPGSSGYLCAVGCDPNQGNVQCEDDQVCCDDREVCVDFDDADLYDPTACGDPHMTGFLGQKFDFTGEDGAWYSLIADPNMHINMRVTSPVPELPEITYITGLSVLTTDATGVEHSIIVEVKDPHNLDSSCPAGVSPCLADGSLSVFLDGEATLLAPGTVSLSPDVEVSAANLPGACRSFGFEKYWERKQLEDARRGRRLSESIGMGEWILGDPTATNMEECVEYVARAEAEEGGVFAHQSEHASFQIVTPKATVRLSHGRLHQLPMRDPTDRFDLPDHLTWQMNMAVDHNEVSRDAKGILGETFVPTRDASGNPIMAGMAAIRGQQDGYRVEGPLGTDFAQDGHQ